MRVSKLIENKKIEYLEGLQILASESMFSHRNLVSLNYSGSVQPFSLHTVIVGVGILIQGLAVTSAEERRLVEEEGS